MTISFVFPPSLYQTKQTMPPLGMAWIAAVLRENGFKDVSLIDCVINKYTNNDVMDLLKKNPPDIVGVSFGTQNRFYALDLIKDVKKNFPNALVVVGGPHPSLTTDDLLKNVSEVDMIIRGEGEYSFLALVKTLQADGDLREVNGLSFRDKNNKIIHNPAREPIQDLDSLPMPARDLLPINKYQQQIPLRPDKICTSILTSRGCPHMCVYCSTSEHWGHRIRYRSVKHVVDEIEHLINTYKLDGVGFFDDVLTVNKQRVIAICKDILGRGLKISWWCEARANTVDEEIVEWMRRAGCVHISMAIESGSPQILKNIRKAITIEQAVKATEIIKKAGIKLRLFFMYSLPGETCRDIKKTVNLIGYLQNKFKVDECTQSLTVIYPGTELERIAKDTSTLPRDFSWSKYFEENRVYRPLDRCKYMPVFEQPNLSYEGVYKCVKKAKVGYYLKHPVHFLKSYLRYGNRLFQWFDLHARR